jgi:hypothetical protein
LMSCRILLEPKLFSTPDSRTDVVPFVTMATDLR